MSETHTPGPWDAKRSAHGNEWSHWIEAGVNRQMVAAIGSFADSDANALLIAAAPDLLAACEAMLDTWDSNDEDAIIEACDMARAAIAKAVQA